MRPESPRNCNRVFKMLDRKLVELEAQIVEMERFHKQLSRYRNRCNDAMKQGRACPVIVEVSDSSESGN